jgi:toxin ParE1/3/4
VALKTIWTRAALRDLESAAGFIARDSKRYASTFVREAIAASRSLYTLAQRGRVVPEFGSEEMRELFVCNYRLIYKIRSGTLHIVAFIHGSRDLWPILSRRKQ